MLSRSPDKTFLVLLIILVVSGVFIFMSASFGLLARQGAGFASVAFNQIVLGLIGGTLAAFAVYKINYKFFQKYSIWIFLFSILLMLLVFVPKIGIELGGANRWINLGITTFQPAELLKFGFILMTATWFSAFRGKIQKFKYGPLPLTIVFVIIGLLLLLQPDTGTFAIILATGLVMFVVAGGKLRYVGLFFLVALIGLVLLASFRPYVLDRFTTFMNPEVDPLGSSYQIQQSLVAVGSGGIVGRGFGQSIQKFNYLPEPIGDSIFAVLAEEFGFVGSIIVIGLFTAFALRGYRIASRSTSVFGSLVVVGIITMVISQSFLNIGAILGVLPLTGLPLLFISHGGTALFFTLAEMGLVLNISRYTRKY